MKGGSDLGSLEAEVPWWGGTTAPQGLAHTAPTRPSSSPENQEEGRRPSGDGGGRPHAQEHREEAPPEGRAPHARAATERRAGRGKSGPSHGDRAGLTSAKLPESGVLQTLNYSPTRSIYPASISEHLPVAGGRGLPAAQLSSIQWPQEAPRGAVGTDSAPPTHTSTWTRPGDRAGVPRAVHP